MASPQIPSFADVGRLAARLLLAFLFLHEGGTLLLDFDAATRAVAPLGVTPPLLAATITLQLVAGAAIALGWHAELGALALALFCCATAFTMHTKLSVTNELLHFEKDLAIAGGMVALSIAGSGALSLDVLGRRAAVDVSSVGSH
jgi:putative oxidoreductase